ncbi:MAG TPA: GMP synthase, partial [Acidimicrobiia bacterium]|nr:GMP synthase [Acidimicrobiia bacterium]
EDLDLGPAYTVLTSHQDQIEDLPPGAEILGWNEHCPVSMLGVGENMIGIQGHPEFDPAYSKALMESRRGGLIPEAIVDDGLASLGGHTDGQLLVDWILRRFSSDANRSS